MGPVTVGGINYLILSLGDANHLTQIAPKLSTYHPQWSRSLVLRPMVMLSAESASNLTTDDHWLQTWDSQLLWRGMGRTRCLWIKLAFLIINVHFFFLCRNTDCDYSSAYVALLTDSDLVGYGMTFTIGRGNDIVSHHVLWTNRIFGWISVSS